MWADISLAPNVLVCPTAGKSRLNGYGYNKWVGGKSLSSAAFKDPTVLPLIADSNQVNNLLDNSGQLADRHSGKAVVGFADGHVEAMLPSTVSIIPLPEYTEDIFDQVKYGPTFGTSTSQKLMSAAARAAFAGWGDYYCAAMPAGWESNAIPYQDTTEVLVGGYNAVNGGVGVYDLASIKGFHVDGTVANWPGITPPTTFDGPDFFDLRIPLNVKTPGTPKSFTGFWTVALPRMAFNAMGRVSGSGVPLTGWADIRVLDDQGRAIAAFQLNLGDGTTASYTGNGEVICTKPVNPVPYADLQSGDSAGYLVYEYATEPFTGWDASGPGTRAYDHTLSFLATDTGITISFATPSKPSAELGGTVTVALDSGDPGADWTRPTWLQMRAKNCKDGVNTGVGGVMLHKVQTDGGLLFGWE